MERKDRRDRRRFPLKCSATLHAQLESDLSIDAKAENLSPSGAFLKTEDYRSFQVNDHTLLTFFLPPGFTGQEGVVGLQGPAVITRIDQENEGIGVQFIKSLKQFERIVAPEVPGKLRYRKLAYYLSNITDKPLSTFQESHPNGFLVERSERFFDKSVIFQFVTDVAEDEEVLDQLRNGTVQKEVLEARVLEIKKRKSLDKPGIITIGRAPDSDIVLYNKMVSRYHAYLCPCTAGESCNLVDIGSTNGTFLDEAKIAAHKTYQLNDGDEICFGCETKVIYFSGDGFYKFLAGLQAQ